MLRHKKAERYFKERRIKYQYIDILKYGMSRGELMSVVSSTGLDGLIDEKAQGVEIIRYLGYNEDKLEKLLDNPKFIKTPVVRNGKQSTVGYRPDIWSAWD